jgi:hypothetical protein
LYDRFVSSSIRTVTVGSGIAPDQLQMQVVDCTTGGDFHPALKIVLL